MQTLDEVMQALEAKGNAQTRKTLQRHGAGENVFGVKIGDLKGIVKAIRGNQALALALYETGNYDAMYLAGLVADGRRMSKKEIEHWAKTASAPGISEYTVPWIASESPHARALALQWMRSRSERIASSGWNTYSGIVATTPDEELDLAEIEGLLDRIEKDIDRAPNAVRYTMNGFVIAVGTYVKPLTKRAKETAKRLGRVEVDMGETACKVPVALEYIEKCEKAGSAGKKRKTIRC